MELSLHNQLIEVFEPEYLQALRNSTTVMINDGIPIITSFLQFAYGQITDIEMNSMEHNLAATIYNRSKPINSVFNKIDEYADFCDLNNSPINVKRKVLFDMWFFKNQELI